MEFDIVSLITAICQSIITIVGVLFGTSKLSKK